MTLKYSLNQNDFLQHQLFLASKTKSIKNRMNRTWLILSIAFLMIGISFYKNDNFNFYFFIFFSILTLLFYPFYQKYHYKNHYLKHININYKYRFGVVSSLIFNENTIDSISEIGESKLNYTAFDEIDEIEKYFFLKIKTGGGIIIPKTEIENVEEFKIILNNLIKKYNWKEIIELNWKW
jgi:YcxB-like protein